MRVHRTLVLAAVCTTVLAGCAATPADTTRSSATATAQASSAPSDAGKALLAKHALTGRSAMEVIDSLDRMPVEERPADLRASVRTDVLLVSGDDAEVSLPIPADRFYLSVAPYIDTTHECFNHSLTTCKGELGGKDVDVSLVEDGSGRVLTEGVRTIFDNGFVGFWLPKDTTATLRISHEGKVAEARVSTDADAPTCLTTMQLA
ncbi:CueP family metal-binding protein [Knoellia locipacati]|uniref:CueP family metal-binding protein n=1 Tax=Knoellia locipacati TaxID=882824 RepID=UPI00384A6804